MTQIKVSDQKTYTITYWVGADCQVINSVVVATRDREKIRQNLDKILGKAGLDEMDTADILGNSRYYITPAEPQIILERDLGL